MRTKRAERIKRKIKRKIETGKEYKYSSRLMLHEVVQTDDGYLVAAEVYDAEFDRMDRQEYDNSYFNQSNDYRFDGANYNYIRQPNRLVNVEGANHFEFLESVIISIDKSGNLLWDNSFKIDKIEGASLEPIVDFKQFNDKLFLAYKDEEHLRYKVINPADSVMEDEQPLLLQNENDEVVHDYSRTGGVVQWYDNYFFVWGYHKVQNDALASEGKKRRSVLFINKIIFE